MSPKPNKVTEVVPTVQLPSTDLIIYRFDQFDDKIDKLDKKVDHLTNTFLTKDEASLLVKERDDRINGLDKRVDTLIEEKRWRSRMITAAAMSGAFLGLASLVVALITKTRGA